MDLVQALLSICGAISIVGGAAAMIMKAARPALDVSKRVEVLEEHDKKDYDRLEHLETMQKQQSKCLAAITDHMLTGNGDETMRKVRDELLESIIEN